MVGTITGAALVLAAGALAAQASGPAPPERSPAVVGYLDGGFWRPGPDTGVLVGLSAEGGPGAWALRCEHFLHLTRTDARGRFALPATPLPAADTAGGAAPRPAPRWGLCAAVSSQAGWPAVPIFVEPFAPRGPGRDTVRLRCSMHADHGGPSCRPGAARSAARRRRAPPPNEALQPTSTLR